MNSILRTANHLGVTYSELAKLSVPCEMTFAYGSKRIVLKGNVTVDHQIGSTKFGPQLQIHMYSTDEPVFEERYEHKKFTRLEIAMPLQEGFNFLNEAINNYRIVKVVGSGKKAYDGL